MINLFLSIVIIAAGFIGMSAKGNTRLTLVMLGIVAAIMVYVGSAAAAQNEFGPALALVAFVGSFAAISFFRKRGKKS